MTFLARRYIIACKQLASQVSWDVFTVNYIMPIHEFKINNPIEFDEFKEFRNNLLIESGNEIKEGDNAWYKIYLAFKSLSA